jgi:hypothetical protein
VVEEEEVQAAKKEAPDAVDMGGKAGNAGSGGNNGLSDEVPEILPGAVLLVSDEVLALVEFGFGW